MLRDNVTRLDMGKKVKEPGHRIHSALPLVYILGGTDFPLAGEVSCRAVSVSPAGRVLLVLDNAHAWFVSGKIPISFQCKFSTAVRWRQCYQHTLGNRWTLISQFFYLKCKWGQGWFYNTNPPPFYFLSASFRDLPVTVRDGTSLNNDFWVVET